MKLQKKKKVDLNRAMTWRDLRRRLNMLTDSQSLRSLDNEFHKVTAL